TYINHELQAQDLVRTFIDEEYIPFPVGEHDDAFDCLARLKDLNIVFPMATGTTGPLTIPDLVRI
ncbi:MAG: hypothetical protein ACE5EK_06210, partial [Nitrospinales bacterium]